MNIDKTVTVNLGKAVVHLKFDWNALAALEEQSGKTLTDLMGSKDKAGLLKPGQVTKAPASVTRLLVWAGVQHEMDVSVRDVGNLMQMSQGAEISAALMEALSAQTENDNPPADAVPDPNAPPVTNG